MGDFCRMGDNGPEEISSKKRAGVYRQVVNVKKPKRRDPRFDDRFGAVGSSFEHHYGFIDEIKEKELEQLSTLRSTATTAEEKETLGKAKTILKDQLRTKNLKKEFAEIKREKRRAEAELVAKGKKPYFAKKAVLKDAVKEKQYKELQQKGQLEKWMAKKSKRKASKHRKLMPRRHFKDSENE